MMAGVAEAADRRSRGFGWYRETMTAPEATAKWLADAQILADAFLDVTEQFCVTLEVEGQEVEFYIRSPSKEEAIEQARHEWNLQAPDIDPSLVGVDGE